MPVKKLVAVGGRKKVCPSEVVLLKADVNYTEVILLSGKTIFVATTIGELMERFRDFAFFRSHKSYVVNLAHVEMLEMGSLLMKNNSQVMISRRKMNDFMKIWPQAS